MQRGVFIAKWYDEIIQVPYPTSTMSPTCEGCIKHLHQIVQHQDNRPTIDIIQVPYSKSTLIPTSNFRPSPTFHWRQVFYTWFMRLFAFTLPVCSLYRFWDLLLADANRPAADPLKPDAEAKPARHALIDLAFGGVFGDGVWLLRGLVGLVYTLKNSHGTQKWKFRR